VVRVPRHFQILKAQNLAAAGQPGMGQDVFQLDPVLRPDAQAGADQVLHLVGHRVFAVSQIGAADLVVLLEGQYSTYVIVACWIFLRLKRAHRSSQKALWLGSLSSPIFRTELRFPAFLPEEPAKLRKTGYSSAIADVFGLNFPQRDI